MADVVVVGASFAGLFAAAAVAGSGRRVTILEADTLPSTPEPRPGVPQGRQAHILLHRGVRALETLLPGLQQELADAGAVPLDTGRLPWFQDGSWALTGDHGYGFLSLTRPLLEHLVRERVRRSPGVRLLDGTPVKGLVRERSWTVVTGDGEHRADLVIDASGRSSRLPTWLERLGLPAAPVERLDAHVGYATRRYSGRRGSALMVAPTPAHPRGALTIPVEDDGWLVAAIGFAPHRPPRDVDAFEEFLDTLDEPAVMGQIRGFSPATDVAVHRQTANVRHRYASVTGWPTGLLVVGDALCAFNPAYGQGITVAATQAEELRRSLRRNVSLDARTTRRLLGRLERRATTAWNIATLVDRSFLSSDRTPGPAERWIGALEDLARHGDVRAAHVLQRSYHLLAGPVEFLHPALVVSAARARLRGPGTANPRPSELDLVSAGARGGTEPGRGRPRSPGPGPRESRSAGRAASPDR